MESNDMRSVWQSQGGEAAPMSLEELRRKRDRFRRNIFWRNVREYVAIAVMIPYFSYFAWTSRLLAMRVGNGLLAAGLLVVARQLHRRAAAAKVPGKMGWQSCAAFHRAQLERQRDALNGIWRWYLGPLLPGIATVWIALSIPAFRKSLRAGLLALAWVAIPSVVIWQVARRNDGAADNIQRQIDELDAPEHDGSRSGEPATL
ncbi:MAG TPA: hypothetical protein VHW09_30590 [Bryobacteraceae bacterium]|nr:hypothetical protein [Bryobacteraceae bacterium]